MPPTRKRGPTSAYVASSTRKKYAPLFTPSAVPAVSMKLNRRGSARPELGYVDVDVSTSGTCMKFDATPGVLSIKLLNAVPQGTSVKERVGKKILLKSFQMRGFARNFPSAGSTNNFAMLVYDKRPQGSLPSLGDILDSGISEIDCQMNNDNYSGRFVILKRWAFALNGNGGTGPLATGVALPASVNCWLNITSTTNKNMDDYVDLKMRPTVYKSGGGGGIGDIEEGALYLITAGSDTADAACGLFAGFRTRFVDV